MKKVPDDFDRGVEIMELLCTEFRNAISQEKLSGLCAAVTAFVKAAFNSPSGEMEGTPFRRGVLESLQRGLFRAHSQQCLFGIVEHLADAARGSMSYMSVLTVFILQCMPPVYEPLSIKNDAEGIYWKWYFALGKRPGYEWVVDNAYDGCFTPEQRLNDQRIAEQYVITSEVDGRERRDIG